MRTKMYLDVITDKLIERISLYSSLLCDVLFNFVSLALVITLLLYGMMLKISPLFFCLF